MSWNTKHYVKKLNKSAVKVKQFTILRKTPQIFHNFNVTGPDPFTIKGKRKKWWLNWYEVPWFGDLVYHYRVLRDGAGKYFLWIVKFDSVNQLIEYHRTSSVSRSETVYLKDMNWKVATALYDFTPDDASEINVKKGDDLKIEDDIDAHWWRGRNLRTNQSGLFPANYVKVYKVASGSTELEDLVTHTVGK